MIYSFRFYFQFKMGELKLISHGLHGILSEKIGTAGVVDMRRRINALRQTLDTAGSDNNVYEDVLLSGSRSEGFRFASSDYDWMYICRNIRVVFTMPIRHQSNAGQAMLLAESSTTKPGFVLLRALNNTSNNLIMQSYVQYGGGYYISSEKWRENLTSSVSFFATHGPCSTMSAGNNEADFAECLKSDRLPDISHCFIQRLHRAQWPPTYVLKRIVLGGCHFVAIGAKASHTEPLEWRISFSLAEKLLVHFMNHAQFLCYGLLKMFLKEVVDVNEEIKGLLCSYFLKTTLFWEISNSCLQWNSANFLSCFWACFQKLLHWINNEYCPNFFIPENNMFANKIEGSAKVQLLRCLIPLYEEGYNCLLKCRSVQRELKSVIERPLNAIITDSSKEDEKCRIETELILEIWNKMPPLVTKAMMVKDLLNLDRLISVTENELELSILQIWRNCVFQNIAVVRCYGHSSQSNEGSETIPINIMTIPTTDATRRFIYLAIHHYCSGRYYSALSALGDARVKLTQPYLQYSWNLSVERYRAAGGEHKPLKQMIQESVTWAVELSTAVTLPELALETHAAKKNFIDNIIIPPLVFILFMNFQCYQQINRIEASKAVLQELTILVYNDNGYHISENDRAISWQILGICQEMGGDKQGAYQSYSAALQEEFCHIKLASVIRMLQLFL